MFNRNLYFLYPAGYMGTYLSWVLHKSEVSSADTTINWPINTVADPNSKEGGFGTAHLHIKSPTHLGFDHMIRWILFNKPQNPQIFTMSCCRYTNSDYRKRPEFAIQYMSRFDPLASFVNIHADDDMDSIKFGCLNTLSKWPIYFKATGVWLDFGFDSAKDDTVIDLSIRNFFIKNWKDKFPTNAKTANREEVKINLDNGQKFFDVRHSNNPIEVPESQYLVPTIDDVWKNVHEFTLKDIMSDNFIDLVETRLGHTGTYDFTYAKKFHPTYVEHQVNLQWFKDINAFRESGVLTDYLLKTNLAQAFVVEELDIPAGYDWESRSTEELVKLFYKKV